MAEQTIDVRRVAGSLGAEIFGVDLSRDLTNQTYDEIHEAFLDHQVLFIRDQNLTPPQQAAFARRFGPLNEYPFVKGLEDAPEIIEIVKEPDETINFGGVWHSDTTYLDNPPLGTALYALEVPAAGGDTMYANMYDAYDTLSDGMKHMLAPLTGVSSAALRRSGGRAKGIGKTSTMTPLNMDKAETITAEHPVIRTHPETGRKALYVNSAHTVCFKGMTEEESKPLIEYLCNHAVRPEFTCRFKWEIGTLAIWDNRCVQHFAINDYHGERRRMHRATIVGDRPH
ncbi:MAG: taurine dioxygenase [Alphaproteobacteria bacterium]|nr:taurine dioxygenase [Alphaproteobacteria bacterium]